MPKPRMTEGNLIRWMKENKWFSADDFAQDETLIRELARLILYAYGHRPDLPPGELAHWQHLHVIDETGLVRIDDAEHSSLEWIMIYAVAKGYVRRVPPQEAGPR